jgi:UPF0716 family protein affecting phage T7 exclusion
MFSNINNKTVIIMAIVIALFTPAVSWAFAVLGLVLSIIITVLTSVNGLGLVAVLVAGTIFRYQDELKELFLGEEEDDENEDPFL